MKAQTNQLVLLLLTAGFALSPIMNTGYYSDDALTSQLAVQAHLDKLSLPTLIAFLNSAASSIGRFFPFYIAVTASFWMLCTSLIVYQLVRIAAVFLAGLAFSLLIKELTQSTRQAVLGAAIALTTIQFRIGSDPILSFQFHLPLTAAFIFLCLLLFHRYLHGGKREWLIACVGVFICGILLYELFLIALPLLICLRKAACSEEARGRWLKGGLFLAVITTIYLVVTIWIRHTAVYVYSGIEFRLSLDSLRSFVYQLSSTLPLSHLWIIGEKVSTNPLPLNSTDWIIGGTLAASAFGLAASLGKGSVTLISYSANRLLLWIGGLLMFMAPLPVALSAKHQVAVQFGFAYLPVFLQSFGLAMATISLMEILRRHGGLSTFGTYSSRQAARWLLASIFSFILVVQWRANLEVIEELNQTFKYPRETIEMAFESGLLEEAPAGSTLLRRHPYLFEANLWSDRITTERSAFYFATTGRIYRLLAIEDNVMPPKNNYALRPPVFFVYFDSQYALAGQLAFADAHASIANEREPGIKLSSLRVFSRSTQGKPERLMLPLRIEQTGIEQERGCRDWLEMPRQTLRSTSTGSLESLVAKTDNAFLENLEGPCRLP